MILHSLDLLAGASFFGDELAFHPTSVEQEARAAELPERVQVVTTEEIYSGATYQPLNLGQTVAQVRIIDADQLDDDYVSPREIAVLDRVPNDIAVVAAVVTEEFQTPLSHVNVLSQQRRTPNMALRGARDEFAAHEGKWVRLTVGAFDWIEPGRRVAIRKEKSRSRACPNETYMTATNSAPARKNAPAYRSVSRTRIVERRGRSGAVMGSGTRPRVRSRSPAGPPASGAPS